MTTAIYKATDGSEHETKALAKHRDKLIEANADLERAVNVIDTQETPERRRTGAIACKLRNDLFKELARRGIKRPASNGSHEQPVEADEFQVAECEIAERLTLLIERSLVHAAAATRTWPRVVRRCEMQFPLRAKFLA